MSFKNGQDQKGLDVEKRTKIYQVIYVGFYEGLILGKKIIP
jgi:hypothetical protein